VVPQRVQRAILHPREEIRVVTRLPQLHYQIEHGGAAGGLRAGDDGEVAFEDLLVGVSLRRKGEREGRMEGGSEVRESHRHTPGMEGGSEGGREGIPEWASSHKTPTSPSSLAGFSLHLP